MLKYLLFLVIYVKIFDDLLIYNELIKDSIINDDCYLFLFNLFIIINFSYDICYIFYLLCKKIFKLKKYFLTKNIIKI